MNILKNMWDNFFHAVLLTVVYAAICWLFDGEAPENEGTVMILGWLVFMIIDAVKVAIEKFR